MCGIAGVAARGGVPAPEVLDAMRDALAHRGPDGRGTWRSADGTVALMHRRLSILDLSPAGAQPMADGAGHVLTFNGEIYNFQALRDELRAGGGAFHTGTDTEVVLAAYRAWGERFLERMQGMFALALWDPARRRLLLARDRAGEKPLFVHHAGGRLAFASELKALLADPAFRPELDPEALDAYLAFGYAPGEACLLRGVRKLLPGHALVYDVDGDAVRAWRYWDLPEPVSLDAPADEEALADELDALLADAVRRQLVADVPVGVLLSGGLDSSLVTAMAARASSRPVRTFTVSFPGHGAHDEAPYARAVAAHFGTEHHELVAEPASVDLLPVLARQFDDPIADSSMVPTYLVSRLIRRHATVALGGDGGDELFGGYGYYTWFLRQERIRRVVPRPVRALVGAAGGRLPAGVRGRNQLIGLAASAESSVGHVNLYFDAGTRRALLRHLPGAHGGGPSAEERKAWLARPARTPLQAATAADFRSFMVDDILVKVDRASMLASLEVRAPFLDPRVVEFAFGRVPDRLRATASERKVLLRRLGARLLPPALDLRRKQGFSLPLQAWMRGEWGGYLRGVLADAPPRLFDRGTVDALFAGQEKGRANAQRLFALAMVELWRREHAVALPA
jgi:asparagine synthase (glutamine-hydrolysing)